MKTAIVTFHAAKNFGAVLQSYALQAALEKMGHESRFVHLQSDHALIPKYRRKQKPTLKGFFRTLLFKLMQSKLDARVAKFDWFLEQRLKTTKRYASQEDLTQDPPDVDAYICGSDQIWNLEKGISHFFYLAYVPDDVRKISYAPSFGTPDIPDEYKEEVSSLISRIDHLSVRERQAVTLVRELTGREACQVCDPVFLLDTKFWEDLAVDPAVKRPYMVSWIQEPSATECESEIRTHNDRGAAADSPDEGDVYQGGRYRVEAGAASEHGLSRTEEERLEARRQLPLRPCYRQSQRKAEEVAAQHALRRG
jgi:hypothetical protein